MIDLTACDLYDWDHAVQCLICQYRWRKILEIYSVQSSPHFYYILSLKWLIAKQCDSQKMLQVPSA